MHTLRSGRRTLRHPQPRDLARYALETRRDDLLEAHLDRCADCRAEVVQLIEAGAKLRAADVSAAPGPDCLDEHTLAAFADATLAPSRRGAALEHLSTCGYCRSAVAGLSRMLSDGSVAREVGAIESNPASRWRLAAPLAVAAVIALLLLPRAIDRAPARHRSTVSDAAAPVPIAPSGASPDLHVMRWHASPQADRYRVTLYAPDGEVLFEATVADTVVGVPDDLPLQPGVSYYWIVAVRTGTDRWLTSAPVEFSPQSGQR